MPAEDAMTGPDYSETSIKKGRGMAQRSESPPQQEAEAIDADAEIARLARLTTLEYELQRKEAADKLVEGERARLNPDASDGKQGRLVTFPEPEPWPEPVSGPALLNGIAGAIRRHVAMPRHAVHAT